MASTYSSLKIQLMATGENAGTWGNVTNDNLGIAIEEAIVGSADVTFASADVTLTLTDTNATQTARNLRLNLTGTVSGAQNLIVPAIEKVYIINNGLSQTITVKNSTGTGIAVPAGKTMYVYNNGTNVVDAITHLTSLTLGTALPVASGGTGSTTATFSGANITSLNGSNISSGTVANARTTASDANGASTIVARDASGNFSANVITANGSSLTALNADAITSGTIANARTTAASANGASTIVARDASGAFSAGTITATFSGSGASITSINGSNISSGTVANARTTASSSNGASTIVSRGASGEFSAGTITATFSGSGASITSINADNISSGTLVAGRGGTGITSVGTSGNVLTSNGTAWVSQAVPAGGGDYIMNVYTTPGTWTKPAGLKAIKVTVVGGGGSGNPVGGGGAGGGSSIEYIDAPAIPGPQPYTVGTGGTAPPTTGGTGGTSSFGGPTAFLSATGGASTPANTVQGGVGSNGQLNIAGGSGSGSAYFFSQPTPPGDGILFYMGGGTILGGTNMAQGPSVNNPGAPKGYGVGSIGILTPGPGVGSTGGAGVVIVEEFY